MRHPARALAAPLLAAAGTAALADAPLVSETADVIVASACQVETALSQSRTPGQGPLHSYDVLGSCGIHGHSQAAIGFSRERGDGAVRRSARVFGKTTLAAPEAGRTGWGLRYGLGADQLPDDSWHPEGLELLGLMTREIAPGVLFHVNLGHLHERAAGVGKTVWSLGVETTADTTVAADFFGDDRSRPWVSAGIGRRFGHGLNLNAGVALQFEQPRVRQLTLGAKIEF